MESIQPSHVGQRGILRGPKWIPGISWSTIGKPIEDPVAYFRDWLENDGGEFWSLWDNVNSWWDIRDLPNVHFVHFANLKTDMPGQMREIAEFLEIPIDEAKWDDIVEHCSFEYMRKNGDTTVPLGGAFWKDGPKSFLNKGTNGRWKDLLTADDIANYERTASEKLPPAAAHWLVTGEIPV